MLNKNHSNNKTTQSTDTHRNIRVYTRWSFIRQFSFTVWRWSCDCLCIQELYWCWLSKYSNNISTFLDLTFICRQCSMLRAGTTSWLVYHVAQKLLERSICVNGLTKDVYALRNVLIVLIYYETNLLSIYSSSNLLSPLGNTIHHKAATSTNTSIGMWSCVQ